MTQLLKRECVSNCEIPSCSSITCGKEQTCILSSQTCDQCPTVSCVSLSLTSNGQSTKASFPKGAIAGIVIIILILLGSVAYLTIKIRRRRQSLQQNSKSVIEIEELNREATFGGRPESDLASIRIQLEAGSDRGAASPASTGHFFSADELLRMSYAESMQSRSSLNTVGDSGAAIMQPNNPLTAVRAKAAVLQFTKNVQERPPVLESCFEDDESILESPIERDLISPSRFSGDSHLTTSNEHKPIQTSPLAQRERSIRSLTERDSGISLPVVFRPLSSMPEFSDFKRDCI